MSSLSQEHTVLVVVVFVSLGGLFLLGFLSLALCFLLFKKDHNEYSTEKTEVEDVEEHLRVKGASAPGRHGAVVLSIDDDVQAHHDVEKSRKLLPDGAATNSCSAVAAKSTTATN